jgi:hypothetical protein
MRTTQIFQKGSRGPGVFEIKALLSKQGFFDLEPEQFAPESQWYFNVRLEDAIFYFQQTHLGPKGRPLGVDGKVGPDTWWALKHPSGKAQKSHLLPSIPRGIKGERKAVLELAIAEHAKNVREIPNGSNRSKEIDKYIPKWWLDKYGPDAKGPAWCCFFVMWVFKEATGRYPCGSRTGSCSQLMRQALGEGMWFSSRTASSFNPVPNIIRPGDIFIISHPRKPGKPGTGHTGFVLAVNKDQTIIGTDEGNCGNRVKVGRRRVLDLTGIINPYALSCQPTEFGHALPEVSFVGRQSTR